MIIYFTKNIIFPNLGDKLTENTFDIFSNMTNLYDNPSRVQIVISPFSVSYYQNYNKQDI